MIVLGFDTATAATAVGLRTGDGELLDVRHDPVPGERPGHTAELLPLAAGLLERAGLAWSDVERIGVGTGPGTFTGLRIGVSTARALAQATGAELVGVSTLAALAAGAGPGSGSALVLSVIDARRGEAFAAAYRIEASAPPEELTPPRALAPERLGELVTGAAGPNIDPSQWMAVGDGAIRFREHLADARIHVAPDDSSLHRVSGAAVCRLAVGGSPVALLNLAPEYVRPPDADLTFPPPSPHGRNPSDPNR